MNSAMRSEVIEFQRACDNLVRSAHQNNGTLTNEECETVRSVFGELAKKVFLFEQDEGSLADKLSSLHSTD
jgi:hypothetical protein